MFLTMRLAWISSFQAAAFFAFVEVPFMEPGFLCFRRTAGLDESSPYKDQNTDDAAFERLKWHGP
jgi:hypothetical protein